MNDRGLSLTPADMLKGYLLANINDDAKRNHASLVWKQRIQALVELGKDEDADGVKSWLRAQHAESIRERKRGAEPKDFEKIATEFHRWVRNSEGALGLTSSNEFARFIESDFAFYTRWYERIRQAADSLTVGLETIHFNALHNFTLQYPVLLAPLRLGDDDVTIRRKLRVVAAYIDILIHRRIWNFRATDYSTMQYSMFLLMREIRGLGIAALVQALQTHLGEEAETFASNGRFRLHGMNGRQIHLLLARITDYIETRSDMHSRIGDYIQRSGRRAYEIEHIWAAHPERHRDEFSHPADFDEYRNRIGGLLLLPRSFNASYGDLKYDRKLPHYDSQNLLARSLHPRAYEHNPGFLRFLQDEGLSFQPHPQFKAADLDARQELYLRLADLTWTPERLGQEAAS